MKVCLLVDDSLAPSWLLKIAEALQDKIASVMRISCLRPSYSGTQSTISFRELGYDAVIALNGPESTEFGADVALALMAKLPVLLLHEKFFPFSALEESDWVGRLQISEFESTEPKSIESSDLLIKCLQFISGVRERQKLMA